MQSKKSNNVLQKFISKSGVYTIAIVFLIGAIIYGVASLSSVFSTGFSADVFLFPVMFMKRIIPNTLFIVVIFVFLIVYGLKHKKLWYLIPVAIFLLGFYWLNINNSVYKAYVKRFIEVEEKK